MSYKLPGRFRRQFRQWKSALTKALIALVQMVLVFYAMNSQIGEFMNNIQLRVFFGLRGQAEGPEQVLIAAIDENSFLDEKLSSLKPWPRELSAEVINNIAESGAKLLILDLLIDPNTKIEGADQAFMQALSRIPSSIAMFEYPTERRNINNEVETSNHVDNPSPEFANAAKFVTPMMVRLDEDGIVRKFYYSKRYYNEGRQPIPLAELVEFFLERKLQEIPSLADYINYYGPSGTIKNISINKLLTKNITPEIKQGMKGKIVVVGPFKKTKVDLASEDQFLTNFGDIFGVEIHATTVGNLINSNWVKRYSAQTDFLVIIIITIISSFLTISGGPLRGSLFALGSAAVLIIVSYQIFLRGYFLPCLVYSVGIVPILIIGILTYHYFQTFRAFKQVEEAMGVSLRQNK